jgi:ubiquinone/menaquinone biosynthesis C-methylase UbiE
MADTYGVWDKLAKKYDSLWVQKYSLAPTRQAVEKIISSLLEKPGAFLLDLGCGTGQLLYELERKYTVVNSFGIDKSFEMIRMAQDKSIGATFFCLDIDKNELPEEIFENALDIVVCCHSFPYYKEKQVVLNKLCNALKAEGILILAQASINNLYDRLVLSAVERTAEPADYLSRRYFRNLVSPYFVVKKEFLIRERFFMPSLCGFVLGKRL